MTYKPERLCVAVPPQCYEKKARKEMLCRGRKPGDTLEKSELVDYIPSLYIIRVYEVYPHSKLDFHGHASH